MEVFRDIDDLVIHRIHRLVPYPRLHGHEVDNADEVVFRADRQGHDERARSQNVLDLTDHAVEVGTETVQLVDIDDPRDFRFVGVAPVRLRLGLDAAGSAEDANAAVEDLQRAIDLDREVNVSGRVDDVEAIAVPEAGGGCGLDRDPPLLFLLHEVGRRRAIVDLTELMNLAGELQDALGGGGLARVNVGEDPNVPVQRQIGHGYALFGPSNRSQVIGGDARGGDIRERARAEGPSPIRDPKVKSMIFKDFSVYMSPSARMSACPVSNRTAGSSNCAVQASPFEMVAVFSTTRSTAPSSVR